MDTASERASTPGDGDPSWTPRQRDVLDLIARGRTNQEVADTLGISLDGAKWHMREILSKPNVDTREEAADYWRHRNGWRGRRLSRMRPLGFASWAVSRTAVVASVAGVGALLVAMAIGTNLFGDSGGGESPAAEDDDEATVAVGSPLRPSRDAPPRHRTSSPRLASPWGPSSGSMAERTSPTRTSEA